MQAGLDPISHDLAYDQAGHPHLVAINGLVLSYRYWDGASWHAEVVETLTTESYGDRVILLLDGQDNPLIIYSVDDGLNHRIRLSQRDGTNWLHHVNMISPPLGVEHELDAARSVLGNVYVSYFEAVGGDLRMATWAEELSAWTDELVDDGHGIVTGRHNAIDLTVRYISDQLVDTISIAYFDVTNQNVNYAYRDTRWYTMATVYNVGAITSLDMVLGNDAWLNPFIVYTAPADHSVRLVYSEDGLKTFPLTIVTDGGGSTPTDIAIAFDNAPRIAYRDGSGQLQYAFPGSRHHVGIAPAHAGQLTGQALNPAAAQCVTFFLRLPTGRTAAAPGLRSGPSLSDGEVLDRLGMLFLRTPGGRQYVDHYRNHVDEFATISWSDPALAWETYLMLQNFMPGISALVQDEGEQFIISQAMIDQALAVWQRYAAQASPELAAVINGELAASNNLQDYVDQSFVTWILDIGVLPPGETLHLPIVAARSNPAPETGGLDVGFRPVFAALPNLRRASLP